mgnify:CR=1 FL=1
MEVTERRNEIMKKLCRRRSDTIANLATELGVSERTVRRFSEAERLVSHIHAKRTRGRHFRCGDIQHGSHVYDARGDRPAPKAGGRGGTRRTSVPDGNLAFA